MDDAAIGELETKLFGQIVYNQANWQYFLLP
jgi:hypothetical protein